MKKLKTLCLAMAFISLTACGDDDNVVNSAADCLLESALVSIDHTKATDNPKKVTFEIDYAGEKTLDNIKWDFGDGTPAQTLPGNTATHTYTTAGTYRTTATVSLNNGECSYDKHNTVTVE